MSEWISVKDKFPRYNQDVLTFAPGMAMPIVVDRHNGYYGEDDDEWYEGWNTGRNITHWMPLPKPPKDRDASVFLMQNKENT